MSDAAANEGTAIEGEGGDFAGFDSQEDMEAYAHRQGWRPEGEYSGSAEFVDAKAFIARADNELPIARAQNRRNDATITELKGTVSRMEASQAGFVKYQEELREREREKIIKELKAEQETAIEEGDAKKSAELGGKIAEAEAEPAPLAAGGEGPPPQAVLDFEARNPWFASNVEMRRVAIGMNQARAIQVENEPLEDNFKWVEGRMKALYPDAFANPAREEAPTVESGGGNAAQTTPASKQTYGNLPAEAKVACDRMVKDKWLTREEYVRDYAWD